MYYGDNPLRPQLSFWFGPMTMIDFLGNYNLWYNVHARIARAIAGGPAPATRPDVCQQVGINSALSDIQNNHPNDCCR